MGRIRVSDTGYALRVTWCVLRVARCGLRPRWGYAPQELRGDNKTNPNSIPRSFFHSAFASSELVEGRIPNSKTLTSETSYETSGAAVPSIAG